MPSLADIPFLSGWTQQNAINQQQGAQQLQQVGLLAQLQQQMQAQQRAAQEVQRNEALRQKIAAMPPEMRTRENILPLLIEAGNIKEIGPLLKDQDKPTAIGAGGLRLPDGTVIPPAARPESERGQPIGAGGLRLPDGTIVPPHERPARELLPSQKIRTRIAGNQEVQEELQADGTTWKEIGKGPRFARSVIVGGGAAPLPKPKAGYRWNADGMEQELIKGGPEWAKIKSASVKDKRAITGIDSALNDTIGVIDDIIGKEGSPKDHPGLNMGTGLTGVAARRVPGVEARNFDRLLETLNAKISFDALAKMRAESPTGGALGNITVRELELLSQSIRPIDPTQSPADFKNQLGTIRKILGRTKERLRSGYAETYSDLMRSEGQAVPASSGGEWSVVK